MRVNSLFHAFIRPRNSDDQLAREIAVTRLAANDVIRPTSFANWRFFRDPTQYEERGPFEPSLWLAVHSALQQNYAARFELG
jgi:hypothetical protein